MTNPNQSIEDFIGKIDDKKEKDSPRAILDEKISELGQDSIEREVESRASSSGLPYVDFRKTGIDKEALLVLTKEEMQSLRLVCFLNQNNKIYFGAVEASKEVEEKIFNTAQGLKSEAGLFLISESSFKMALKEYDNIPKKTEVKKVLSIKGTDLEKYKDDVLDIKNLGSIIANIPISDVITIILAGAIFGEASDIHIEAEEGAIKIRFRVDGVLRDTVDLSPKKWKELISRIKLISGLKLNITDKPQDGRISVELPEDKLDIRVSTVPTAHGESVVMRILRSSSAGLRFEDLGLRGKPFSELEREVRRPNGMILVTGPTGSGKTTTLYAILNKVNDSKTKIITLEDPIEYNLKGINQSQIDKSKDYDFAKGLRSVLRQDPDVVMVGEIRDLETADTAINAALTGHLVLSTLHTNDASGAIPRFLAMGVKPFLLAPAINAVIGQRLVRKICQECKEQVSLDGKDLERVKNIIESIPKNSGFDILEEKIIFYKGKGCDKCGMSGYKGRIGIYEIFIITSDIEKMILNGKVSEADIKEAAQEAGMITMAQDGILKVLDGITTVEEVFRVSEE